MLLDSTLPVHRSLSSVSVLPPAQKGEDWNQTLKDLKHSIQQVRKDLSLKHQETTYKKTGKIQEEEDESNYSTFSRGDLSHSTTSADHD